MKSLFRAYFFLSLLLRIFVGFLVGSLIGGVLRYVSIATGRPVASHVVPYAARFGSVLVSMRRMIVIPIIFLFETANNVTGDMVCTWAVARKENLLSG